MWSKTLKNAINLGSGASQPVANTFEFDGSKANSYKIIPGANSTVNFSNLQVGETYALEVQQGAGAPWTVTPSGYTLPASQSFTLLPNVGDITLFIFINYRGTNIAISAAASSSNSVTSTDDLTLSSASGKKVILQEGTTPTLRVDDSDPFTTGVAGCCLDLTGNASGLSYIKAGAICVIQGTNQLRFRDPGNITQIQIGTNSCVVGTSASDTCVVNSIIGFYGHAAAAQPVDMVAMTVSVGTPAASCVDVTGAFSQSILNNNFASLATQINKVRTALRSIGLMA